MVRNKLVVVIVAIAIVAVVLGVGYVLLSKTPSGTPSAVAPTVTFTSPAYAATGTAINTKMLATFSEAMDPLTITSGGLTLDAQGNANAVFIFEKASTLITTSGRHVILAGGAQASNVFWQVGSSATLGTNSVFVGTIMADQTISFVTGATLNGRALARIAAVTLDTNSVTKPAP